MKTTPYTGIVLYYKLSMFMLSSDLDSRHARFRRETVDKKLGYC